ncbi:hypothetical protein [Desulfovibrio sp.]|uniref:hypothetical protein n=1 Tax=Desulfovibrio sp. TaxID=885 RepID=UPI00257E83E1|nr:hypothetical protein [Desulfovibrio sp.]MBR2610113.1 hypothetical protein [Desulfovibrio sp.]
MKKSIFFLKKNGFFDPHPTYWIFRSFFSKILKIPAGEAHLFFLQTFVAVATRRKMVAVQGNMAALAVMLFFSQHTRLSSG